MFICGASPWGNVVAWLVAVCRSVATIDDSLNTGEDSWFSVEERAGFNSGADTSKVLVLAVDLYDCNGGLVSKEGINDTGEDSLASVRVSWGASSYDDSIESPARILVLVGVGDESVSESGLDDNGEDSLASTLHPDTSEALADICSSNGIDGVSSGLVVSSEELDV